MPENWWNRNIDRQPVAKVGVEQTLIKLYHKLKIFYILRQTTLHNYKNKNLYIYVQR